MPEVKVQRGSAFKVKPYKGYSDLPAPDNAIVVNNKKIIDWLDPSFFTSNMASARLPTLRIFKSTVFLNKVASQLFCSGSIALGIHDKATVFLKESDIGFKFALKKDCLVLNNSPLVKKLCEMGLEGKFKLIFKEFENLYVLLKI